MGIKGLYSYLSRRDLPPKEIDVHELAAEPHSSFELDLLGTFHSDIHNIILRRFSWQSSFTACGHAMASIIRKIFGPLATVTIHIDGPRCEEKTRAYRDRDAKRTAADAKLDTLIANMETKSNEGKWESRSHMIVIKKNLRQLFTFSHNEKRELAAPFGRYNNFVICHCRNEADVCIAAKCTPTSIAVSGDSDLLIYPSIKRVLRPIPRRHHMFALYEKQEVLQALGFSRNSQLLVYGIISDNDYTPNIPTFGLATNAEIISALTDTDAEKLTVSYVREVHARSRRTPAEGQFDHSINVFFGRIQTQASQQPTAERFLHYHDRMRTAISARYQNKNNQPQPR
ncbi:hypothetical protein BCR41DRAFT_347463 [Lobosporangium transversale]|uniref:PIN domain-like protein n=1 Tax=Lobosporangium transversale TaxID=64571 RepID=A0A1Y2GXX3_9FUNG|nr:hypothetical protein BCR41DRAFT_347463 [Lobosporangium transversale]ORZ27127.1 hypothetical protein BCR41DRAFT_347463 [Lobosporangium transversale]|eukprot:XP_021884874.1 hypothetical protein BCR41DRAFT_347463 [Lobosporangium transversale]